MVSAIVTLASMVTIVKVTFLPQFYNVPITCLGTVFVKTVAVSAILDGPLTIARLEFFSPLVAAHQTAVRTGCV